MKLFVPFQKRDRASLSKASLGKLVAQLLIGAWRPLPSMPDISAQELNEIALLLLRSGAGGLAWCRVRHSGLRESAAGQQCQQAYRLHSLQAALHERNLKQVLPYLRSFGVEPILVKGWATARLYPELGMRPYGDLDLCVLPDHYERARDALKSPAIQGCDVDLHKGFDKFYDRQTDDIFARSQSVMLGDLEVRVLSAEDDLRFLCLHLLRHGAVRPLWLCDIAVLLETQPDNFDWDMCLSGSHKQADWVACTIELAQELLDASLEGIPESHRVGKLPRWFVPTVLEEWGIPYKFPGQIATYLRHPVRLSGALFKELPHHWPNPIEATMTLKGPFNELPRLPFQIGHVFSRTAALLSQMADWGGATVERRS